jgi:hypothetical protein
MILEYHDFGGCRIYRPESSPGQAKGAYVHS